MVRRNLQKGWPYYEGKRVDTQVLGEALRHYRDLQFLQQSELTKLPSVMRQARDAPHGAQQGRAVQAELLHCARTLTWRRKHPIARIATAIDNAGSRPDGDETEWAKESIGIPLPRNKIDLARYYAIRLVMEGVKTEAIAAFLGVDPRTASNYIAQAKERMRLTLESRQ